MMLCLMLCCVPTLNFLEHFWLWIPQYCFNLSTSCSFLMCKMNQMADLLILFHSMNFRLWTGSRPCNRNEHKMHMTWGANDGENLDYGLESRMFQKNLLPLSPLLHLVSDGQDTLVIYWYHNHGEHNSNYNTAYCRNIRVNISVEVKINK